MHTPTLIRGAVAGLIGGMMMGMFAMLAMWLDGTDETGFWTPLNLIAHTIWRDAPLDEEFSTGGLILGAVIHMMMSMGLGAAVALLLSRVNALGKTLSSRVMSALVIAMAVWVVMEYVLWPLVDEAAADAFTTWIFAVAHAVFGMVTPLALYALTNTTGAAQQPSQA